MLKDQNDTDTAKTGRIVLPDAEKIIDCLIHEISDTGAHLKVNAPLGMPPHFLFAAGNQLPRKASVVWWDIDAVGHPLRE
jgi:hypothetical protein